MGEDCEAKPFSVAELHPVDDDLLAEELLVLQRASYEVGATLIGSRAIPALHEAVDALRRPDLTWLGVRGDERVLGALAFTDDPAGLDIERLVVAPAALRRGIGRLLVTAVQGRARQDGRWVTVRTGRNNAPARTLYTGAGFEHAGDAEAAPRLMITRFRWRPW